MVSQPFHGPAASEREAICREVQTSSKNPERGEYGEVLGCLSFGRARVSYSKNHNKKMAGQRRKGS